MHKNYSTPTVSFADRQDFRPRVWTPGVMSALPYRSSPSLSVFGRGFAVSAADIRLMASWLRGKL
jgi:hypothetical protein